MSKPPLDPPANTDSLSDRDPSNLRHFPKPTPSSTSHIDFTRLVPQNGLTLGQSQGLTSSAHADDPFATSLIPSSDLTHLLSDPALRRRYREGRYVPGKNAAIKFSSLPTCLSVTASSISNRCDPKASTSIVTACALHIGTRYLAAWEPVTKLRDLQETFVYDSPRLAEVAVRSVNHLLKTLFPPVIGKAPRVITVSESVELEFVALSSATGVPGSIMAPYCVMATMRQQPKKYLNDGLREEMDRRMDELWRWLRFRARMVEAAIEEFDGAGEMPK